MENVYNYTNLFTGNEKRMRKVGTGEDCKFKIGFINMSQKWEVKFNGKKLKMGKSTRRPSLTYTIGNKKITEQRRTLRNDS